jgi:type II secretory pathway component GspD/PulD (secretin)
MSARSVAAGLLAAGLLGLAFAWPANADGPAAPAELVTRVYSVADLVLPVNDAVTLTLPNPAAEPRAGTACGKPGECPKPPHTDHEQLMQLLAQTIAPESWNVNGGPGTMQYFATGMALVVRQTPAVHRQVAELFDRLHRLQDIEVAVEVRLLTLPDSVVERLGIDFNLNLATQDGEPVKPKVQRTTSPPFDPRQIAFLNDTQVLQLLEALQGDQRASVQQAPKMTLFNGQAATINLTDEQYYVTGIDVQRAGGQVAYVPKNEPLTTGHSLSVRPTVSADGRFVQVRLKLDQTTLATPKVALFPFVTTITPVFEGGAVGQPIPFTQFLQQPRFNKLTVERAVAVPDGGSVLLGGLQATREVEKGEFGPPILTKVPYVNRLFKNVRTQQETATLLVLVTPRVICRDEREVRPPATADGKKKAVVRATFEEQERTGCCCRRDKESGALTGLLKKYHEACAAGQLAEAAHLAVQALAIDPACFSKAGHGADAER